MEKKIKVCIWFLVVVALVGGSFVLAFEWPQSPLQVNSLFSEVRGDGFNTSVVFAMPGEVSVAENGKVIMTLENEQSNMGWFESPLGNAVIVAHRNEMLSVYSNLVNIKVNGISPDVLIGDVIGVSGQSAWKDEGEGVGFQIIDTKMKTLINPVALMQESPQNRSAPIVGAVMVNRNNESFPMYNGASFKAGAYTLYMQRPEIGMIHNSSVTLNGEIIETISYDTLAQVDENLIVVGNKNYTYNEIYPNKGEMRLAEVLLSRGTNTIEVSLSNVGRTQSYARYRISVN